MDKNEIIKNFVTEAQQIAPEKREKIREQLIAGCEGDTKLIDFTNKAFAYSEGVYLHG